MTDTTATKTKRTKIDSLFPPSEIREVTKARRAWLAAEVERINALPEREAKIVGTGSYQSVSVYAVVEVAGRLRHRGVCQCCGNLQVVDGGVMVLHGYNRPGDGEIIGRCPGVARNPLNVDRSLTDKWLSYAIAAHDAAVIDDAAAEANENATRRALYAGDGSAEPDAYKTRPSLPNLRYASMQHDAPTLALHADNVRTWRGGFPLTAAYDDAKSMHRETRNTVWQTSQTRAHFQRLIDANIYGTPLTAEVVA